MRTALCQALVCIPESAPRYHAVMCCMIRAGNKIVSGPACLGKASLAMNTNLHCSWEASACIDWLRPDQGLLLMTNLRLEISQFALQALYFSLLQPTVRAKLLHFTMLAVQFLHLRPHGPSTLNNPPVLQHACSAFASHPSIRAHQIKGAPLQSRFAMVWPKLFQDLKIADSLLHRRSHGPSKCKCAPLSHCSCSTILVACNVKARPPTHRLIGIKICLTTMLG